MDVQVTGSGQPMAEKFFDDDIIYSKVFEQPCCKSMTQVMEVEFMYPRPFNYLDWPKLRRYFVTTFLARA